MSIASVLTRPIGFRQSAAAITLVLGTTLTVGTAWLFELVGGYIPCALCLTQRIPYYVAIPLALVAAIAAAGRAQGAIVRLLLLAIGCVMLWSLGLGVYHAGVEWAFWPGPAECAGGGSGLSLGGDLLAEIDRIRPPSCDQAAGRFLGLSFAGWNVLASAFFAALSLRSAFVRGESAAGSA